MNSYGLVTIPIIGVINNISIQFHIEKLTHYENCFGES